MFKLRFCAVVTALCLLFLSGGCATVSFGEMPDTSVFDSRLQKGVSTKADVLAAIGAPRGYGKVRLGGVSGTRVIWFYEYVQSDLVNVDLKMLLVLFDGDKYDGHLWFSSFEKVDTGTK